METTLYDLQGKEKGKISLPALFSTKISTALMHEVVTGYLANQRAGTHDTKSRGEVSGGGRKPWKEKGTGNARAGSNRSPLWRKGGIIFGPKPHGYYQSIPQQKRRLSLFMALTTKASEGAVMVVDDVTISAPKTKHVAELLKNLKIADETVLLVIEKMNDTLKTASRNIPGLVLAEAATINTYQVMWANRVIFTSGALKQLEAREEGKKQEASK